MSFMYLTCGMHNVQYVGETQQSLNARFRLNESMINKRKENPVADHLNESHYHKNSNHFSNHDSCGLGLKWMVLLRYQLLQIVTC